MNKDQIKIVLITIIFVISSVMLGTGISYCVKLDTCVRPIVNNTCEEPTSSCPYNDFWSVDTGSCCSSTSNQPCICCQYFNSLKYNDICVIMTALGAIGVSLFGSFIIYLIIIYYRNKHAESPSVQ